MTDCHISEEACVGLPRVRILGAALSKITGPMKIDTTTLGNPGGLRRSDRVPR